MRNLSKLIWLPVIPRTEQPSKTSKILLSILHMLILLLTYTTYGYHQNIATYSFVLVISWFIFISYQDYIHYDLIIYKDLKSRRFIGFKATLQDIIAIRNPATDYHYQIKISTNEPIPQDQQQEWLITPNLYPINLRILVGHTIYIESLANSHLIFNLKPYFFDQKQQEIFFTQHYLEYLKANGKYKKCRYNNIKKVELDTLQTMTLLSIWVKEKNIQIKLDKSQLKLMENLFFPKLFMFSQRQYLEIKNQQKYGIIWQS